MAVDRGAPAIFTRHRLVGSVAAVTFAGAVAACGVAAPTAAPGVSPTVAASPASSTSAASGAAATAAPSTAGSAALPAGALRFQIVPGQSKATFRVREQLADHPLDSDAVGSTGSVSGQLVLQPNGTIVPDASKIAVDVSSLATDQPLRDNFIKRNTLQAQQYPTAEFVPTKVEGLPSPLPASGQYTFKLTGLLTLHGVQKEVTWDATATRDGSNLTGTATTEFKFGDFGMTPPKAPAVLSVVDNIRLETNLVASATA